MSEANGERQTEREILHSIRVKKSEAHTWDALAAGLEQRAIAHRGYAQVFREEAEQLEAQLTSGEFTDGVVVQETAAASPKVEVEDYGSFS